MKKFPIMGMKKKTKENMKNDIEIFPKIQET